MDYTAVVVAAISAAGAIMAAYAARQAQKNTKPISNGWSSDVVRRLERIETAILNHLEDHAEAELKRRRRDNARRH